MAYCLTDQKIGKKNTDATYMKVFLLLAVVSLLKTMVGPGSVPYMFCSWLLLSHCCSIYGTRQKYSDLPAF